MKQSTMLWAVVLCLAGGYLAYRAAIIGNGMISVHEMDGTTVAVDAWEARAIGPQAHVSLSRSIGVWVAAIFTLAIFSFLYRDNPFYKIAESTVVGVSAAYWMVVAFWTTLIPNLVGKIDPEWVKSWAMPGLSPVRSEDWYWYPIVLLFGVMLLFRLSPKGAWIARWPLAFIIGTTAGIRLLGFIQADFLSQTRSSIRPLVVYSGGELDIQATLEAIFLLIGVLCGLVYFFFSFEHKGVVGKISKVGIWYLMITFGAAFGFTVMGRIALLAMRLEFLFNDWLWLIDPNGVRPPL